VFDISKEVLYADLFGFLGVDGGWDMQEGFTSFGSILDEGSDLSAYTLFEGNDPGNPHVFDFLNGKICVCWYSDSLWSDINDDHHWSGNKSFEEVVNLLVGSPKFGSCVIPPDHPFTSCDARTQPQYMLFQPGLL